MSKNSSHNSANFTSSSIPPLLPSEDLNNYQHEQPFNDTSEVAYMIELIHSDILNSPLRHNAALSSLCYSQPGVLSPDQHHLITSELHLQCQVVYTHLGPPQPQCFKER